MFARLPTMIEPLTVIVPALLPTCKPPPYSASLPQIVALVAVSDPEVMMTPPPPPPLGPVVLPLMVELTTVTDPLGRH